MHHQAMICNQVINESIHAWVSGCSNGTKGEQ